MSRVATVTKQSKKSKAKRPVGRPPSEFDGRYQLRHSFEQLSKDKDGRGAWERAAAADGRDLQNWIRRTLDAAAGLIEN